MGDRRDIHDDSNIDARMLKLKAKLDQFKLDAEAAADQKLVPKQSHLNDQSKLFELGRYWMLIRLALTLVMVFTGKKADAKIKEIIEWGDGLFA